MKKIFLFLIVCGLGIVISCKKPENVAPVADTEVQSALDAAWATYVITDIDQICAFMGEDEYTGHFYVQVVGQSTSVIINDPVAKQKAIGWNNTKCVDGKMRDGSIFMYYGRDNTSNPLANENSRYYRDFGFVGRIAPSEYKVDGWLITLYDPAAPAYVYNKLTTDRYDPRVTKLTWLIAGKWLLSHPSDPSKNIVWDGELLKTLTNSTDPDIFNVSRQSAINWVGPNGKAGLVSYSGHVNGFTSSNIPFTMTIDARTPLIRDFSCSADPIANVAANTMRTIQREEHHPFIAGIATFNTGTTADNKYPRQIYFGNENSPATANQCDNVGEILIQGNSYKVNFLK